MPASRQPGTIWYGSTTRSDVSRRDVESGSRYPAYNPSLRCRSVLFHNEGSGFSGILQEIQRVFKNSKLEFVLVRGAERLTNGKRFGVKRAGGAGLFGLIGRNCNQNGSDTHALDGSLNRDDRPMAERSATG